MIAITSFGRTSGELFLRTPRCLHYGARLRSREPVRDAPFRCRAFDGSDEASVIGKRRARPHRVEEGRAVFTRLVGDACVEATEHNCRLATTHVHVIRLRLPR